MPRKSNRSIPLLWMIVFGALVILAGGGIYLLRSFLSDPYRAIPELPVDQYVDNSLSFQGNSYKVTGRVENQLAWSDKLGRLISFETEPGDKSFYIAILLPRNLDSVNVQKGQRFEVRVKIIEKGLLEATEIRKV